MGDMNNIDIAIVVALAIFWVMGFFLLRFFNKCWDKFILMMQISPSNKKLLLFMFVDNNVKVKKTWFQSENILLLSKFHGKNGGTKWYKQFEVVAKRFSALSSKKR